MPDQAPRLQQDNVIGQGSDFIGLVRNQDSTDMKFVFQLAQVLEHLGARFAVQTGQWFVQQEYPRFCNQGAADGNALTLATGQVGWSATQQRPQLKQFNDTIKLASLTLPGAGTIGQVCAYAQMRKQATILEHVANFAVARRHIDAFGPIQHDAIIENDPPTLHIEKSGDGIEYRGLAGAGIAKQGKTTGS